MTYSDLVLSTQPIHYFRMDRARFATEPDVCGGGISPWMVYQGGFTTTRMPSGDRAAAFDGESGYAQIADSPTLSPTATKRLTWAFWARRDCYQFPHQSTNGYVPIVGKGEPGAHEWTTRQYSRVNAENRPDRVSSYAFNPQGGLGTGSYRQRVVKLSEWFHVVSTISIHEEDFTPQYSTGYTRLWMDGVRWDTDALTNYDIHPADTASPVRVATRYGEGHFCGAIGHLSFWDRELTDAQVMSLYLGMEGL